MNKPWELTIIVASILFAGYGFYNFVLAIKHIVKYIRTKSWRTELAEVKAALEGK